MSGEINGQQPGGKVPGGLSESKLSWSPIILIGLLVVVFSMVLKRWLGLALSMDLHSHTLLIPVVSIYLVASDKGERQAATARIGPAVVFLAMVSIAVLVTTTIRPPDWPLADLLCLQMGGFLCGVWAVLLGFFGGSWFKSHLFSVLFLIFMLPLPGPLERLAEEALMVSSAVVSEWAFQLGGIPVHRSGQALELPGIVLEVAQECSGIRSTLVLTITSILAAHLFLRTNLGRIILVAAVVPLGVMRNALRIYVIGWLCVNRGIDQIDGWIHRKGGPVFFLVSLVPLLLLVALIRRVEQQRVAAQGASSR